MRASVVANRKFGSAYLCLTVALPSPVVFVPGQFAMIGFGTVLDPLLPRAFSIYRAGRRRGRGELDFLYKVMGKGTATLARLRAGETVNLLAPLGRGFRPARSLRDALLVAGGVGVPPVVALAEALGRGPGRKPGMQAFVGGRTREDVLCGGDFRKAGARVHVATEDGSLGRRGLVTELLESYLEDAGGRDGRGIFACGPPGMLRAVAGIALARGVPCQLSMEASMACGFGACMGCSIPVKGEDGGVAYKLCCLDGPVFEAGEIIW